MIVVVALMFFYSGYSLGKKHGFEDYLEELKNEHEESV